MIYSYQVKSEFFAKQLDATRDALLYSLELRTDHIDEYPDLDRFTKIVHPEWTSGSVYFGTWTRSRLLWHILVYEETLAYPSMRKWVGETLDGDKIREIMGKEQEVFDAGIELEEMKRRFNTTRDEQIAFIRELDESKFEETMETAWGKGIALEWIISKTLQHSFEHGNKMMRHGIFGDLSNRKKFYLKKIEEDKEKGIKYEPEFIEELQNL